MTYQNKMKSGVGSNLLLEHAFKTLHAPLYFYALKFIPNSEIAKDLVQDAFLSILNVDEHKDIENLKAYLYRAVRNNCLNHMKHSQIASRYVEGETERISRELEYYDTHETLIEKELHTKIIEAIEKLPAQYKVPFKLSRFEGLKTQTIAKQLALPIRTVETQIYRALKMLRKDIGNQGFILFSILYLKKN